MVLNQNQYLLKHNGIYQKLYLTLSPCEFVFKYSHITFFIQLIYKNKITNHLFGKGFMDLIVYFK